MRRCLVDRPRACTTSPRRRSTGSRPGAIYALGAVGLTLVYGILKLVNFAHGDFLTFGAYMAYLVNVTWGLPLVLGDRRSRSSTTALLGIVLEKVMWAPMRAQAAPGMLQLLLMSIGLAFVIRYAIQFIWGTELRQLDVNDTDDGRVPRPVDRAHAADRDRVGIVVLVAVGLMLRLHAARQADARALRQPRPRRDPGHRHRRG